LNKEQQWRKRLFLPKSVAVVQGVYYTIFGLWSLLSISSFQALTGPKTDLWLVKTVGLLLLVSGLIFLAALMRHRIPLEIAALGIGTALVLASVDVVYVATNTISRIYLLDALAEIIILVGWILALDRHRASFL
jgi:hypothetical protein